MTSSSALTDHTGYWLRMVSNAVSQEFSRKLAGEGVTVAEWVFLRALAEGEGLAPTLLAAKMAMTRGAISKLADRLEAKGLIARTDSETDGRAQSLSLTAEGQAKVPVLARLADLNDAEYFGVLAPDERAALDRTLRALVQRRGLTTVPTD
ncbi:MarR family winged helix-turn-helix transcriptional regulator [Frigidibacter sp.]|uniref:MarR family winged helix-turn-helix transcriptional regulator n=1 Tax=Frigidibacter sp. TaxID=2586418 RepID=UPI002734F584|nr:MarR family transcriptional regulator [Frigidibacter sp.]MDP3339468.1 MarR family transcriptional regulator [Frigidibacter sp.]